MSSRARPERRRPLSIRRPRNRRLGVTGRLLTLFLVPLAGLSVYAFAVTTDRRAVAERAERIEVAVERVGRIAQVRAASFRERLIAEVVLGVISKGIRLEDASRLSGVDLEASLRSRREDTDRALAALGADAAFGFADELARARAAAVATAPDAIPQDTLTGAYLPVEDRLTGTANRILAGVEGDVDALPGGGRIAKAFTAMRGPLRLIELTKEQMVIQGQLYYSLDDRAGGEAALRRRLDQLATSESDIVDDLTVLANPTVAAAASRLRSAPETEAVHERLRATVGGDIVRYEHGVRDWLRISDFNKSAIRYSDRLLEFLTTSMDDVAVTAASLKDDAARALRTSVAANAGVVIVMLAVSLAVARSISVPLRRLAHQARSLSDGDLDVARLATSGPPDIATTADAFNDLVENLRLLDAKASALADLDFESDALAVPLPGRLGRSLQRSASVLSGSVSERDELRQHMLYQATHDPVTGLHNRGAAAESLAAALARSRRIGRGVAAVVVDIHDFKRVNDTYGPSFGDRVLAVVASRIARTAETSGTAARLSGDEFLVVVEDVIEPEPVTRLAAGLVDRLGSPVGLDGVTVTLSVCVGIAFCFDGDADPDQLLAWSDLAAARAKGRGPGSVEIYDQGLQELLLLQADIEAALKLALTGDELLLQYQPVVDLGSGRMTSVEALVRWNRPGLGLQPPDSFIPVAERSGLIVDVDQWVLDRAARQVRAWQGQAALDPVQVAVNISGRHILSGTLHRSVTSMLDQTAIDPQRLVLELTETVLVDDLAAAATQLDAVRALGIRIALDDFGTGFTSLNHLRRLPIDIIKIDRSLVARIHQHEDRALVGTITGLAHQLGRTITAEGVETAEQYDALRELGADRAQGYLMSRPLPPDRLESWAAEQDFGVVDREATGAALGGPGAGPPA